MRTSRLRLAAAFLAVALVAARASAQEATIFPAAGSGGNYVIAVLADGFTDPEHWRFDLAAERLFVDQMMHDPFFDAHKASFTIRTVFKPANQSGASQFNITPTGGINNCYIQIGPDTTGLIEDAVKAIQGPTPERVVILANYEGVSIGCTQDTWTYVSSGSREGGGVIEHEFGHLAGLFDEYELDPGPHPVPQDGPLDGPNCSMVTGSPIWKNLALSKTPTNPLGCDFFHGGIVRPFATCRMMDTSKGFCPVCERHVSDVLEEYKPGRSPVDAWAAPASGVRIVRAAFPFQTPQPPAASRAVRLLVELNAQSGTARVLRAAEVNAAPVARHRRTGDYMYEISDNGQTLETSVLAGNPFEGRSYGGAGVPHGRQQNTTARVVVMVQRATVNSMLARNIGVTFYKLGPSVKETVITPAILPDLKSRSGAINVLGQVGADEIKKALQSPPPAQL